MRIILLLSVVALALYLAARQFDWLSSTSPGQVGQSSATLPTINPGGSCGIVADVRFARSNEGPAMFVDLGRPHPIETLQVVIPRRDIGHFTPSPAYWEGKTICVSGPVKRYRGRPEIVARNSDQIQIK